MRAASDRRFAYQSVGQGARQNTEWLQAGISSFAYRLAHLALPRPALVAGLSVALFLF